MAGAVGEVPVADAELSPAGLTADDVMSLLSVTGGDRYWVRALDEVGPPPFEVTLPPAAQATSTLAALGVGPLDAADIVATLPSAETSPEWWWLLQRSVHRLVGETGKTEPYHVGWPDWTAAVAERPLAQRCFMAHVYLAMLPHTRAWHASRGVPADVSQASLADLARHMAIHRRVFGSTGIDASWWLTLSLRGEVYDLGRLQFTYFELGSSDQTIWWYPPEVAAEMGSGFGLGESCIGVHIPEGSPMTPEACDDSFRQAAAFMPRYFPPPKGQERRLATCWSWLLDDQLADLLPADSNIVKFQRRFELVPGSVAGDHSVLEFVFRRVPPLAGATPEWLDTLPCVTTLERAVIGHLRQGGHFRLRSGWTDLT
jgi:hypothetical protein